MRFELKLAWKYFRAKRKSLARFTSIVAVVGIAAGVASLIVAQSLARGFSDEMQAKILANTAHISVSASDGGEISDWRATKEKIENISGVQKVSPTTFANAVVIGEEATSYAILKVRDGAEVQSFTNNSNPLAEISVGARLAEKLNLKIGDKAEILTFENQNSTKRTFLKVVEIFQTGLYEYDATWIYVAPETFAYLADQAEFTPKILSVSVENIYAANETAQKIRNVLGENFRVVDWQEANRPLFAALSLERKVALAIISLIVFVAVLNITTTLALLAGERKLDIAILRTCGAQTKNLILIFLLEGLFLSFAGIFAGVALGLTACFLGNYFKIINISADVYSLSSIPFHPQLENILLIIFLTLLLCLAAVIFPAVKASRIKPLENLRTQ